MNVYIFKCPELPDEVYLQVKNALKAEARHNGMITIMKTALLIYIFIRVKKGLKLMPFKVEIRAKEEAEQAKGE